jgi:hypothetical protein
MKITKLDIWPTDCYIRKCAKTKGKMAEHLSKAHESQYKSPQDSGMTITDMTGKFTHFGSHIRWMILLCPQLFQHW